MSNYPDGFPQQPPPAKQGMSTTVKVLLIVGGILGVTMLICCGVAWWGFSQVKPNTDPAQVRVDTQAIAEIAVPEDIPPLMSWNMMGMMKMAIYGQEGASNKMLMLMQMSNAAAGGNPEQMKIQLEESMRQQGQNAQVTISEQNDRDLTIRGETVTFEFAKGTEQQTSTEVWQVTGVFTGKGGPTLIMMIVPTAEWSEERIVEFLQSIK